MQALRLLLLLGLLAAATTAAGAAPRTLSVLLINDLYRINGVEEGAVGGLARVRTLRKQLQQEDPELLMLHAGDILFPSLLSREYDGEQMIDVLNLLDGAAGRFDGTLFATFGNHEFDQSKRRHAQMLNRRVEESEFTWLSSNIDFRKDEGGRPLVGADHLKPSVILQRNGIRVGLFGLTIDSKIPEYVARFRDPLETAREMTQRLRAQGAELVIALTHLNMAQDLRLLRELGDQGPDLIFGGHEHHRLVGREGGRFVFKADADARSALLVRVRVPQQGAPEVAYEYRDLDQRVARDPAVQQRVDDWLVRHDAAYCAAAEEPVGCLDEVIGHAQVRLVAEELQIRGMETNLGDWVLDQALNRFRDQGAQVAFINAGSLRLNQDIPPGAPVTRRRLLELFAYPAPLYLIEIDGATLQQVIDHAIQGWPGEGRWLQVAGFAWRHHTEAARADALTLLTPEDVRPIRPDETLRAVVNGYLIDPAIGNQDGYRVLSLDQRVETAASPPDLKDLVIEALRQAGKTGIAPARAGRICQLPAKDSAPCQAILPVVH